MIMHRDATKMKAIAALAAHWNIDAQDIVAFGDDLNDIDMLAGCGIGVAMGNALDEVKAIADDVCETNDNDGLATWLKRHV
jgi:hydroxymethylpyrimidine pyrophosphatase-like HAD family hydrolase